VRTPSGNSFFEKESGSVLFVYIIPNILFVVKCLANDLFDKKQFTKIIYFVEF
jgi:hypothetical protein